MESNLSCSVSRVFVNEVRGGSHTYVKQFAILNAMKIAVLNKSFLTAEHLERLKKLGVVDVYESTNSVDLAIERLKGAEVAVADCWETNLGKELFGAAHDLKYVTLNSTGYDRVDVAAAKDKGIKVANVPGFSTDSVAEYAIALMLAIIKKIPETDRLMRQNPLQIDPANQEHAKLLSMNIRGKTLGVIGLGAIGERVAQLANGLGMKVIGYNRTPKELQGVESVGFDDLLAQSDVVSMHTALNDQTKGIIGKDEISKMKKTAYLINTARGDLIDEQALIEALTSNSIAGAGLDMISTWDKTNPLLKLQNVVLAPHIGWFTTESLDNMGEIITANIESYAQGNIVNVVS